MRSSALLVLAISAVAIADDLDSEAFAHTEANPVVEVVWNSIQAVKAQAEAQAEAPAAAAEAHATQFWTRNDGPCVIWDMKDGDKCYCDCQKYLDERGHGGRVVWSPVLSSFARSPSQCMCCREPSSPPGTLWQPERCYSMNANLGMSWDSCNNQCKEFAVTKGFRNGRFTVSASTSQLYGPACSCCGTPSACNA